MDECGCAITHTNNGVSVRLWTAHSYGTEMLPVLRRCVEIFSELTVRHGPNLLAAYTETLHEAQALLQKVDHEQPEERDGRATRRYTKCDRFMGALSHRRTPATTAHGKTCLTSTFRLWFRPAEGLQ